MVTYLAQQLNRLSRHRFRKGGRAVEKSISRAETS